MPGCAPLVTTAASFLNGFAIGVLRRFKNDSSRDFEYFSAISWERNVHMTVLELYTSTDVKSELRMVNGRIR